MPGYSKNGSRDERVKVIFIPTDQIGRFSDAIQKKLLTNCLLISCGKNPLGIGMQSLSCAGAEAQAEGTGTVPAYVNTFVSQRAQWMDCFLCGEINQLITKKTENITVALFDLLRMGNNEHGNKFYGSKIREIIHLFFITSSIHFLMSISEIDDHYTKIYDSLILNMGVVAENSMEAYYEDLCIYENSTASDVFEIISAIYDTINGATGSTFKKKFLNLAGIVEIYTKYGVGNIDFHSVEFHKFAVILEDQIARIVSQNDIDKPRISTSISEYALWNIIRGHSYLDWKNEIDNSKRQWSMPDEGNTAAIDLTASENAWRIVRYMLKNLFSEGKDFEPLESAFHPLSYAAYVCWNLKVNSKTPNFETIFAELRQTENERNSIDLQAFKKYDYTLITRGNMSRFPIEKWEAKNIFDDGKYWNAFSFLMIRIFNLCKIEEINEWFPPNTNRRKMLFFALSQCDPAEENVLSSTEKFDAEKFGWILEDVKQLGNFREVSRKIAEIIDRNDTYIDVQDAKNLIMNCTPLRAAMIGKQYFHILKKCISVPMDDCASLFPDLNIAANLNHIGLIYKLREYNIAYTCNGTQCVWPHLWSYAQLHYTTNCEIPNKLPGEKLFALYYNRPSDFIDNCTSAQFTCLVEFLGKNCDRDEGLIKRVISGIDENYMLILRKRQCAPETTSIDKFLTILLVEIAKPTNAELTDSMISIINNAPDIAQKFAREIAGKIKIASQLFLTCNPKLGIVNADEIILFNDIYPLIDCEKLHQYLSEKFEDESFRGELQRRMKIMEKIQVEPFHYFALRKWIMGTNEDFRLCNRKRE
ncbi:MAG: hypothetical protein LBI69_02915 [Puniceicoccales bacterium]|jgi:hypothetical protein|nr:hypothetical protein [Puniceicoccales bacterium]